MVHHADRECYEIVAVAGGDEMPDIAATTSVTVQEDYDGQQQPEQRPPIIAPQPQHASKTSRNTSTNDTSNKYNK